MNFTRLVITDGRTAMLKDMLDSFAKHYDGPPLDTIIVDDSGNPDDSALWELCPGAKIIRHPHRQGLAAAIRTGWAALPLDGYVIHLEDDCIFTHDLDLDRWSFPLRADANVQQVVLQRGPNNGEEHEHGGILRWWLAQGIPMTQRSGYVTHQHLFSLQPNIYRATLARHGWPEHGGEREFTNQLLAVLPDASFAYLGSPESEPVYLHAGYGQRMAGWVL